MIYWTEHAARQFIEIEDHIALSRSQEVASRIASLIENCVQRLNSYPMSGRPGRVPGTRELVVPNTPFIVAYALEQDRIVILAIYHGAQRWPDGSDRSFQHNANVSAASANPACALLPRAASRSGAGP